MITYENIIFDLGGVIINLNYEKSLNAFSKLAGKNLQGLYEQYKTNPLFSQFERGEISSDDFRSGLKKLFGFEANDSEIDQAWNAILGDIPTSRIELINEISNKKRTFILSNTNEIHKKAFDLICKEVTGQDVLDGHFEKAYYSHLINMSKPNTNIYEWVLKQNDLDAKDTLFIDDSIENLKGAEKLGIHTLHIEPSKSSILEYRNLLLA